MIELNIQLNSIFIVFYGIVTIRKDLKNHQLTYNIIIIDIFFFQLQSINETS